MSLSQLNFDAPPARWRAAVVRRRLIVVVSLCCLSAAMSAHAQSLHIDEPADAYEISFEQQQQLAERFAPVLVFHRDEKYFPTTPLFPLAMDTSDARPVIGEGAPLQMGTADERRASYEALTLEEKARLASVFFRAYHTRYEDEPVIVIEYWLYYVHNTYRVRGGAVFPFWMNADHPNDLEHIHVIVRSTEDGKLVLHKTYSSAHAGTMPANRHLYSDSPVAERGRYLIELGSHAVAPDVNGDGLFTPGQDGTSGYKLLWGIRDRGRISSRYRSDYMDIRDAGNSVVFANADAGESAPRLSYRLVPVEELREEFAELDLNAPQRQAIFEVPRHWFRRLFGGNDGRSDSLLVPPPHSRESTSIGLERFGSTDRGLLAGTLLNVADQGGFVGARYAYFLGDRFIPDLMAQADAVVTRRKHYLSAQFMMSYPLDGSTTLMGGRVLVVDVLELHSHHWDWMGGVEFSVGRMRIFAGLRNPGPITGASKEVRLAYLF